MIFAARQLVEKCREHDDALLCCLNKAYDSVPRTALWSVLERCGVPSTMLSTIQSFHEGTRAESESGMLPQTELRFTMAFDKAAHLHLPFSTSIS